MSTAPGQLVHREDVAGGRCGSRPGVGDRVEHLLQRRADGRGSSCVSGGAVGAGPVGPEGEEMIALGVVELQQRGCQRLQHTLRRASQTAALHAHVVVDRDAGQQGNLFSPQALDPSVAAICGQPGDRG